MPDSYDEVNKTINQLMEDVRALARRVEVLERTVKGVSSGNIPASAPEVDRGHAEEGSES